MKSSVAVVDTESLHLTQDDKHRSCTGMWLNDKLVDAVNSIFANQLHCDVQQSSLLLQVPAGLDRVDRRFQILHDNAHWVAVFCDDDKVMFANSMSDNISPFVVQQLTQLYARLVTPKWLPVHLVLSTQQSNSSDCTDFAAAFFFQWALLGTDTSLNINFDLQLMRMCILNNVY